MGDSGCRCSSLRIGSRGACSRVWLTVVVSCALAAVFAVYWLACALAAGQLYHLGRPAAAAAAAVAAAASDKSSDSDYEYTASHGSHTNSTWLTLGSEWGSEWGQWGMEQGWQ